jgi:hypothetical protein
MDYGFMCSLDFTTKDDNGHLITWVLQLITHYWWFSHYIWVFLVIKPKTPPTDIIITFLKQHGNPKAKHHTIRTNKDSELWGSYVFQETILQFWNQLHQMPHHRQKGLAERPNQMPGTTTQWILHAPNLGSAYWSFALIHATYVKNWLLHQAINYTPDKKYTRWHPSTKYLCIFGCPVIVWNLGENPHNLDMHTLTGVFLSYTATDKTSFI